MIEAEKRGPNHSSAVHIRNHPQHPDEHEACVDLLEEATALVVDFARGRHGFDQMGEELNAVPPLQKRTDRRSGGHCRSRHVIWELG